MLMFLPFSVSFLYCNSFKFRKQLPTTITAGCNLCTPLLGETSLNDQRAKGMKSHHNSIKLKENGHQ